MTEQALFKWLLRVHTWLITKAYDLGDCHQPQTGEIKMNFIVKNDNPNVRFSIDVGDVTDAEGEVLPDDSVRLEVTSTDPAVLGVSVDEGGREGEVTFGRSGQASFEVAAYGPNSDEPLATGSAGFTVTTGDPNAVSAITPVFEGLVPVDEEPPADESEF